ncbi:iron chaperone [Spirosoma pomorum]
MRATIRAAAPEAKEAIKYGMPAFVLHGNLVYFAGFKNHIGFYATPNGDEAFASQLADYKRGRGSIQFPLDKPLR